MYPIIRKVLEENEKTEYDSALEKISSMSCGEALNNWFYKGLMTPTAVDMIKSADPNSSIPEKAAAKMLHRVARSARKKLTDAIGRLDAAEAASIPSYITVNVEWGKSRLYGANPYATVYASGHTTTGRATGCGYDKESAAVASALNQNPAILRIWCDNDEAGGKFAYSMYGGIKDKCLPWMDGGCGMSAVKSVFAGLGYSCTESHGSRFDSYVFTKEG